MLIFYVASSLLRLPQKYARYIDVFLKEEVDKLLDKKACQYTINTIKGYDPPYSLIYNLSEKELKVLYKYITFSLKKG